MATVQATVDQIMTYLRTAYVAGSGGNGSLRAAPDNPPDQMNIFPFAIAYADTGRWLWGRGVGDKKGLHEIAVEIHWARRDLGRENEVMGPWIERVPNLMMLKFINDNKWNSTIDAFGGDEGDDAITYTTGPLGTWGGVEHFGIRFVIHKVKIHSNIE